MMELKVKHFLDGLTYLDTLNLEIKLNEAPPTFITNDNIFFDLSKCRFAELGALVQLVLIIESLIKRKHNIYIALPTTRLTTKQSENHKNQLTIEKNLKNQILTTNFIKKTGFISILQEISKIYKIEIYFTEEYDYVRKGEKINTASFSNAFSVIYNDIIINDENYKFLLPFKLIDCFNGFDEIKDFENKFEKILQNHERGIENLDVKVIKNVVLSELIKNVKIHAQTKYAIFTVGLIKTSSLYHNNDIESKSKHGPKRIINQIEKEHLKNIIDHRIESQVEIYFGDSGIGLLNETYSQNISKQFGINKKNKERLLEYSFNKWSTIQDSEPRRGTKGLYRLKRIVDKYKGMVHIKTSNSNGGFFNGKFEYRDFNPLFNGTLISIRLNPYKEIKSFKLASIIKQEYKIWTSEKIVVDKDLNCINTIKQKVLNGNNLLLITDIGELNLSNDSKIVESLLYEISYISHPSAIVLYLINNKQNIDNDTIELLTESVQIRIKESNKNSLTPENETPDFEEVHDPVLVIGNNNQTFWYGGNEKLIKLINESYSQIRSRKNIPINELMSYKGLSNDDKLEIQSYLESNNNLVVLNYKGEIEFNFYGIENHYEKKIINYNPKLKNKIICTPKLNVINEWIDISELVNDDEYGFALCLYIKFRKNYELEHNDISTLDKQNTYVLIDHNQQYNLTKKFIELLGLKNKNIRNIEEEIDYTIPKRIKLFNDNSKVIFLTTIVSSSETIRRMVKYAKRDKAIPSVILCLMNYRRNKIEQLETWNDTTKIISILKKHNEESEPIIKNEKYFNKKNNDLKTIDTYINPNFREETEQILFQSIKVEEDLLNFIKNNKFLHYNHYGQNNKRHFTFYLDKRGILDSLDSVIYNKIIKTITTWKTTNEIVNFTLYVNQSLISQSNIFCDFLTANFSEKVKAIDVKKEILRDKNSIYFDFGILTGESINNLINKVENVDKLLVCLLFNQSINSNANIYKKIDNLKFKLATSIFSSKNEYYTKSVHFEIEYIHELPLSFFNSESCPICEHRRALDYFKFDDSYFKSFSDDRRERLKQNAPEDIHEINYPVDFYYSDKEEEKKQELSKQIVFQMYELKILLENASIYTKYRIDLFEILYKLYSNIDEEIKNSESNIYSILYYLSHEINWLQQEPLSFRDFRILLSKISFRIATIDINILKTYFENTNKYDISSKNLTTRYKYSAISVLRSTDKLLFCQNIRNIITSAINSNDRFSDNLLQNTLYHISSIFKNTYNKSEVYFLEIESNLNSLLNEYSNFSSNQINAIKYVLDQNRQLLINFRKVDEEPIAFKKMKDQWEEMYIHDMPKHPEPYQEFKALSLEQHESTFQAIKINQDLQSEREILEKIINNLPSRLENVKRYVSNNILYHFSTNLSSLKKSKYFKDEFNNYINATDISSKFDKLSDILETLQKDVLEYITCKEEYNNAYNFINDNLIIKKNVGGSTKNSKFLDLLNDFPLSFNSLINEVFPLQEFPLRQNTYSYKEVEISHESDIKVYFSKSIFKRHLENIKENLKQKINDDVNISDTIVKFELTFSDEKYVRLVISYNNTDNWSGSPNPLGSLNTLKKHLEDFGGYLNITHCNSKNKFFILDFKFLRYE